MHISQNTREYKMTWGSRWLISQWKRFCNHQIDTVIFLSSYVRCSTGWDFISSAFRSHAVILVTSKCIHVTLTQLYARRMLYDKVVSLGLLVVFTAGMFYCKHAFCKRLHSAFRFWWNFWYRTPFSVTEWRIGWWGKRGELVG